MVASFDNARGEVWGNRIYVKQSFGGNMNSTKYSSMMGKSVRESTNIDIRTTNTENNDLTLPNVFNTQMQQV